MLMMLMMLACQNEPAEPMTVVSYNAGLAVGFVASAEERSQPAIDAIAGLNADVVCVQEVWTDAHVDLLESSVKGRFDHRLIPDAAQDDSGQAGCPGGELDELMSCAVDACGDACADDVVDCVFESCPFDFLALETGCLSCTMAAVGSDLDATLDTCTNGDPKYAYDGAFGTALLSAHPLLKTDELVFDSTTNRRSVLYAEVDGPMGPTHVFCTHLTPVFTLIPYPRDSGSWAEEQADQIQALRTFIDDKAGNGPVILLGDMNTGPDGDGVDAQSPENYAAMAQGYSAPYVEKDGRCTYCVENALNDTLTNEVIDHVLVKGLDAKATKVDRILDDSLTVDTCDGSLQATLSDHYGISVTFEPNE